MNVIETGERISKEIDEKIDFNIISAVVYGSDIHSEPREGMDCNLVLVLDRIDAKTLEIIESVIKNSGAPSMAPPLLVEMSEIEGMMDSVPLSFLNILVSYQTVYGRSIFKGLSSINHEHLRAQTEQSLRENLINARRRLSRSFNTDVEVHREIDMMRGLLKRSIQLYCILKKPWLTEDREKWEAFFEDFPTDDIWLKRHHDSELRSLPVEDLRKFGFSLIDHGIKPILKKVDEMGPN